MNARNTAGGAALRNLKRRRDKGKNTPNKKEDSRAMSRWAEANKSRCPIGCISITRRPGTKGAKTISRKSRHRPFYTFRSAILDQRRFYYVPWYSVGSAASCISSPSLFGRIRVVSIAYLYLAVYVCAGVARGACKKRVVDAGRGRWRGRKRMKRKRSTRRCRRNERWQKGVRPDMGEKPVVTQTAGRERSLFII